METSLDTITRYHRSGVGVVEAEVRGEGRGSPKGGESNLGEEEKEA